MKAKSVIGLPEPTLEGELSVEAAIARRRSRRRFGGRPLTLAQLGQLLWSAQGITGGHRSRRAAPSAGGTFPLELFVAVGQGTVGELAAGVYHYAAPRHVLELVLEGDARPTLAEACLGQDFMAAAPADILIAADVSRTAARYGDRAPRYVHVEVGHAAENVHLQAEALGLASVPVGAFRDDEVAAVCRLEAPLAPLYIVPVGFPA